jgi:hypothetical protein
MRTPLRRLLSGKGRTRFCPDYRSFHNPAESYLNFHTYHFERSLSLLIGFFIEQKERLSGSWPYGTAPSFLKNQKSRRKKQWIRSQHMTGAWGPNIHERKAGKVMQNEDMLNVDSAAKPPISWKMSRFPKENLNDFNNHFFQKSGEQGLCSRIEC